MDDTTPPRRRRQGQRPTAAERAQAQDVFLRAFAVAANLTAAARQAGVHRDTVYSWQEHDAAFSLRFKQAEAESCDVLRAEIFRRAVQGVEEPVTSMGKVVRDDDGRPLMVRKYSDRLLEILARARMAEFRERQQVDMHATFDYQAAADEADRRFAALAARPGARRAAGLLGEPEPEG